MLPTIPAKRYFTIGEVAELCDVKPHVLRYWEQEFTQLRPIKRRGNRRYYQHHEVLMIRRIRDLLYGQGFTISGARNRLQEANAEERQRQRSEQLQTQQPQQQQPAHLAAGSAPHQHGSAAPAAAVIANPAPAPAPVIRSEPAAALAVDELRRELLQIRELLTTTPDS